MAKTKSANGDGTLRERKPGQWEFRVVVGYDRRGKATRKSFYGKTATAAKKAYKDWLKDSGKPQIEHVTTVGEWAEKWLETYVKGHVADGTYINYRSYTHNHVVPALGHLRFDMIKPVMIEEFFNLRAQMSRSARNHILAALRGIFRTAIDNGYAVSDPTARIRLEKKTITEPTVWTASEIKALLEHLPLVEHGDLVQLLLYTGLRRGELVALQWNDVDMEQRTIVVRRSLSRQEDGGYALKSTKSGKERVIGIADPLAQLLLQMKSNGLYVVKNPRSPMMPLSVNTFERYYKATIKNVNKLLTAKGIAPVPELSIHKCRHTYATYLIKGGAAIRQVQKLLGHSTVAVTEIYAHVDTDDLVSAVTKIAY